MIWGREVGKGLEKTKGRGNYSWEVMYERRIKGKLIKDNDDYDDKRILG